MRKGLTGFVAVAVAGFPAPAAGAEPDSGTLSVLTYNVAGLPDGISGAPSPRAPSTTAIGARAGACALVHVQEDFDYHANLYAADRHPYRTPTSGGAGIGSGLNAMASLPYDADDFERVSWTSCQLDSEDCLTPKGFTSMRLRLAGGVFLDVYNLHTNAGTNPGDLASRAADLDRLSAFIGSHSAGNAVLVMGDTNTRYTRAGDTIGPFAAANGLTDAWVRLERGGVAPAPGSPVLPCDENAITDTCEVVDKVLYRGSKLVGLAATSYHDEHAAFLDEQGRTLSDHDPIAVGLAWTRAADFRASDRSGGPHRDYFTDLDRVPAGAVPAAITVRGGARVDRIGLTLADGTTLAHGGGGGTETRLPLAAGEYPEWVFLCRGSHARGTRGSFSSGSRRAAGRRSRRGPRPTTARPTPRRPAGRSRGSTAVPATRSTSWVSSTRVADAGLAPGTCGGARMGAKSELALSAFECQSPGRGHRRRRQSTVEHDAAANGGRPWDWRRSGSRR
ncbi:hypothetical protein SAMN04489730_4436 [Amycolatopsis australiensis]|uniref:Inositol polyphosphate-related phosphatase domain-containing protein n=1 Tax=Amycolatopsis australiensis TaxID=546364 RepID=A0A1K1S197_9PSEU|nr:endonuclease [Amycolatopsis australiensis]SFW78078.1 hypothetical protein SAMN04489730_4436 [Amycolatopsis australiensis]